MKKTGTLFVISAPSGTGKTSLVMAAVQGLQDECAVQRVITYTSKKPRTREVHAHDYYFVSTQEFEQKIKEGFFLEWSNAYGAYYGTARSLVDTLNNGMSCMVILDRLGARALKQQIPEAVLIWIYPHNVAVLKERLLRRNQDDQPAIEYRLQLANQEMQQEQESPFFTHHILNDHFESALEELKKIVRISLLTR